MIILYNIIYLKKTKQWKPRFKHHHNKHILNRQIYTILVLRGGEKIVHFHLIRRKHFNNKNNIDWSNVCFPEPIFSCRCWYDIKIYFHVLVTNKTEKEKNANIVGFQWASVTYSANARKVSSNSWPKTWDKTFPPKEHNVHPLASEEGIPFGKVVVMSSCLPFSFTRNPVSMERVLTAHFLLLFPFLRYALVANHIFLQRWRMFFEGAPSGRVQAIFVT